MRSFNLYSEYDFIKMGNKIRWTVIIRISVVVLLVTLFLIPALGQSEITEAELSSAPLNHESSSNPEAQSHTASSLTDIESAEKSSIEFPESHNEDESHNNLTTVDNNDKNHSGHPITNVTDVSLSSEDVTKTEKDEVSKSVNNLSTETIDELYTTVIGNTDDSAVDTTLESTTDDADDSITLNTTNTTEDEFSSQDTESNSLNNGTNSSDFDVITTTTLPQDTSSVDDTSILTVDNTTESEFMNTNTTMKISPTYKEINVLGLTKNGVVGVVVAGLIMMSIAITCTIHLVRKSKRRAHFKKRLIQLSSINENDFEEE